MLMKTFCVNVREVQNWINSMPLEKSDICKECNMLSPFSIWPQKEESSCRFLSLAIRRKICCCFLPLIVSFVSQWWWYGAEWKGKWSELISRTEHHVVLMSMVGPSSFIVEPTEKGWKEWGDSTYGVTIHAHRHTETKSRNRSSKK